MSQHPLNDRSTTERDTRPPMPAWQFSLVVIGVAVVLNGILLWMSLSDVFPRGRPGMHNFTAMFVGTIYSPSLNGLLMLICLVVGAVVSRDAPYRPYGRVAVAAPLLGAAVNLGTVLVIVPWHGSAFAF